MEGFLSAQAPEFVRMKPLWKGGPGICLLGGFCVHTPLRTPEPEGQLWGTPAKSPAGAASRASQDTDPSRAWAMLSSTWETPGELPQPPSSLSPPEVRPIKSEYLEVGPRMLLFLESAQKILMWSQGWEPLLWHSPRTGISCHFPAMPPQIRGKQAHGRCSVLTCIDCVHCATIWGSGYPDASSERTDHVSQLCILRT